MGNTQTQQVQKLRADNTRLTDQVDIATAIQNSLENENAELRDELRQNQRDETASEEIFSTLELKNVMLEELQQNNNKLENEIERLREEIERTSSSHKIPHECHMFSAHSLFKNNQEPWIIQANEVVISNVEIGSGSYGKINVGTYRGARVAVKSMHGILHNDQLRTEFEREILFNSLCRHPCIVQFVGVANPRDDNPLIVMEHLDRSLRDLRNLDENPFEVYHIIQLAKDVAAALCYLHGFKPDAIIHRDVSAGNILLWRSSGHMWRGKLADFGSATFVTDERSACPGAPFYSAPEAGKPERHSTKMDIFSLGVCVLEMYAGNFQDQSTNGKCALVRERVKNMEMRKLLSGCFAEQPEARPSAEHFICILELIQKS